jgi:hypothetical protein
MPATKERHAHYQAIYRFLTRYPDLVSLKKIDGFLWAAPTGAIYNLIQDCAKFKPRKSNPLGIPNNCRPERKQAIEEYKMVKMGTLGMETAARNAFDEYKSIVHTLFTVLTPTGAASVQAPDIIIRYLTRFTSSARLYKIKQTYDMATGNARHRYKRAVFLTLTTDPKRFRSLWEANRHLGTALNQFMSFLQKRKKQRLKYVAAYEFTKKTRLLHVHLIIYGTQWIAGKEEISAVWQRCEQGKIIKVYQIRNDGAGWHWLRQRPQDAHNQTPDDYISKYIRKALYNQDGHSPYWVINKRFFTCSQSLIDQEPPTEKHTALYHFLGTFDVFSLPDFVQADRHRLLQEIRDDTEPPPTPISDGETLNPMLNISDT